MMLKFIKEENKNIIFLILFISLILVCLPRFDRADRGPVKQFVGNDELYEGLPIDILIYTKYITYFRTGNGADQINPPYSYRVLVPFLASQLPYSPMTSLNLINLIFLLIGLIFLYKILKISGVRFDFRIVGCLLYIFSFPMFYYATSGYIDGSFVGLEITVIYFILSRNIIAVFILIFLGCLLSEKIVILLPFMIAFLYREKISLNSSLLLTIGFLLIYFAVAIAVRKLAPSQTQGYVWLPGELFLMQNIFRPKAYLSFIITLGIPGILAIISYFKFSAEKVKTYSYFYIGFMTSIALYIYSFFSAWADGRTIWTIYPFAIPLTVLYLQNRKKLNDKIFLIN